MGNKKIKKTNLPKGISWREDRKCYMGRITFKKRLHVMYDKDLKQLENKMDNLRNKLKSGDYFEGDNIIFDTWFETWMDTYKINSIKRSTQLLYKSRYKLYVKDEIGDKRISDINSVDIQRIFNNMRSKDLSKSTIMGVKILLGSCLGKAVSHRMIRYNPISSVEIIKGRETKEKYVFTENEQASFLEYIRNTWAYDIVCCMVMTGMRTCEAIALRWKDIDIDNRLIHINNNMIRVGSTEYILDTPKTKSSRRSIPIIDSLYDIIIDRINKDKNIGMYNGNVYVFRMDAENIPIEYKNLYNIIRRSGIALEYMGMVSGHITCHTLRHTFATRAIESGIEPQILKAILGHSSITMTMDLYVHVLEEEKINGMKLLNNVFK